MSYETRREIMYSERRLRGGCSRRLRFVREQEASQRKAQGKRRTPRVNSFSFTASTTSAGAPALRSSTTKATTPTASRRCRNTKRSPRCAAGDEARPASVTQRTPLCVYTWQRERSLSSATRSPEAASAVSGGHHSATPLLCTQALPTRVVAARDNHALLESRPLQCTVNAFGPREAEPVGKKVWCAWNLPEVTCWERWARIVDGSCLRPLGPR